MVYDYHHMKLYFLLTLDIANSGWIAFADRAAGYGPTLPFIAVHSNGNNALMDETALAVLALVAMTR